jgi:hypothetical protein
MIRGREGRSSTSAIRAGHAKVTMIRRFESSVAAEGTVFAEKLAAVRRTIAGSHSTIVTLSDFRS